ncbi:hypothetical protein ACLOJK_022665 [Asimina triloba]
MWQHGGVQRGGVRKHSNVICSSSSASKLIRFGKSVSSYYLATIQQPCKRSSSGKQNENTDVIQQPTCSIGPTSSSNQSIFTAANHIQQSGSKLKYFLHKVASVHHIPPQKHQEDIIWAANFQLHPAAGQPDSIHETSSHVFCKHVMKQEAGCCDFTEDVGKVESKKIEGRDYTLSSRESVRDVGSKGIKAFRPLKVGEREESGGVGSHLARGVGCKGVDNTGRAKEREGSVGEGCDRWEWAEKLQTGGYVRFGWVVIRGASCSGFERESRGIERYIQLVRGASCRGLAREERGVCSVGAVGLGRSTTAFGVGKQAGRVRKKWAIRCSSRCELQVGPVRLRRVGQASRVRWARRVKRARRAKSSPGGPPIRV